MSAEMIVAYVVAPRTKEAYPWQIVQDAALRAVRYARLSRLDVDDVERIFERELEREPHRTASGSLTRKDQRFLRDYVLRIASTVLNDHGEDYTLITPYPDKPSLIATGTYSHGDAGEECEALWLLADLGCWDDPLDHHVIAGRTPKAKAA